MKHPALTQTQTPTQTQFLSVQDVAALVSHAGVAATLTRLADYILEDYRRWPDFDKCARVASHSMDGVIELMPISDAQTYAFKYVNGHPKNTRLGLPTVMAFGVLADVATGIPVLLSELTLSTALRTAAMSAVAARALARPDSKTMALIGNGAQAEFQALAFHHLLGIEEIRLFDTDALATRKLMRNLQHTGLRLSACNSIAQAVRGADIVTTVTADKSNATILTPELIEPGMHINGVGGDCPGKTELHPDVLRAASVFVQYEPQTRIEGDLQQMPLDFAVTELWQVLRAQAPGRTSAAQITLFDSVGFALEDYSALRYLREAALELGLGQKLSLLPELANPKDLFSLIRPDASARANAEPALALAA
ncbi:MAG: ornithine cyclodeaminase [Gammaproteobacteria bacterium]|uniref:ornithine cyclodeaminase n=1 Tax=Rhodoferax sp. TaxID=50421 RepID=UPI001847A706|nr:ornithine cyclodeaminase [Rhodoferax sp.]MBU3900556.1 ornithine cyclodeaminase [Gammaproteobacteria bacterium]MBA3057539.1 ornithine cyclodeaminase [Rhodoferax sp.]MBU3996461.1 ornithine cyclodeaminase [Gammaproteobacteria bacterium]MBU4080001.1 ornithine cyclodeaminase [Gammaproteobacteria bacterium]MBU4113457.1 ornithine cyclodeaminase [Gammaproteobacteria bacterium]